VQCSSCGKFGHNRRACPDNVNDNAAGCGYGLSYGCSYGYSYGYAYGFGGLGAAEARWGWGWANDAMRETQSPAAAAAAALLLDGTFPPASAWTTGVVAAASLAPSVQAERDGGLELRAAKLWLRSRRRTETSGERWPLSLSEACERAGIEARFRQNVHNKAMDIIKCGAGAWVGGDGTFPPASAWTTGEDTAGCWVAESGVGGAMPWWEDGDDDDNLDAELDAVQAASDDRERAVAAARDLIAEPRLTAAAATARHGLRRHQASWVGKVKRRLLGRGGGLYKLNPV
jgi:hypothetical protein